MDVLLATGEQTTIALTAIALHALGIPAVSLTGAQAGIVTDGVHTKAKNPKYFPKRIHDLMNQGNVVIVAGFSRPNHRRPNHHTRSGRVRSHRHCPRRRVEAELCQIYTDVDGVYTADPRIVPAARKLEEISTTKCWNSSSLGAKVMQSRSVEFAKNLAFVFEVRSSLNENPGTIVKKKPKVWKASSFAGVSLDKKSGQSHPRRRPR